MNAYKFLAAGAVAPFTGFRWPTPAGAAPAEWVEAPDDRPERGVHACRLGDLPHWIDEELWRVELGDPAAEATLQLVAPRGRLLGRITAWDAGAARRLGEDCAWRARGGVVAALREGGEEREAAALAAARDLAGLGAAARALARARGRAGLLAGYLGDLAATASAGLAATAAYVAARCAVALAGSESADAAERALQASWFAVELRL